MNTTAKDKIVHINDRDFIELFNLSGVRNINIKHDKTIITILEQNGLTTAERHGDIRELINLHGIYAYMSVRFKYKISYPELVNFYGFSEEDTQGVELINNSVFVFEEKPENLADDEHIIDLLLSETDFGDFTKEKFITAYKYRN